MVHDADPGGSTYVKKQGKIEYIYGKRMLGDSQISEFIGRADDPKIQGRAESYRNAQAASRDRRKILGALKSAGLTTPLPQVGRILEVIADAGLFADGQGILIGTAAYQSMDALVGMFLPSTAMMTGDIDVATATLALRAKTEGDTMDKILQRADKTFQPIGSIDRKAWPWRFKNDQGFLVELLMPVKKRNDESTAKLRAIGAGAMRLQQLEWLIKDPVRAVVLYGAGVPIRVPDPARFAVHKLMISGKRRGDSIKYQKDLAQAAAICEALSQTNPGHLAAMFDDARKRGKRGWADPINAACKQIGFKLDETGAHRAS